MAGQGVKLILQTMAFVIVVRVLGPHDFGLFALVLAVTSLFAAGSDVGSYHLNVRDMARGVAATVVVEKTAGVVVALGLPVAGIATLTSVALLSGDHLWAVVPVVVAVVVLDKAVMICMSILYPRQEFFTVAWLEGLQGAIRLLAAVFLFTFEGGLQEWAFLFFLNSVSMFVVAVLWLRLKTRPRRLRLRPMREIRVGMQFVVAGMLEAGIQESDKLVLGSLATADAVGRYAAAMRVTNVAQLPLNTLFSARYPGFFDSQSSSNGQYLRQVQLDALKWAALLAPLIYISADYIDLVFGAAYIGVDNIVKVSAFVILARAIAIPALDALSGAGRQDWRVRISAVGLAVNVVLAILFVPLYSALGALMASVVGYLVAAGLATAAFKRVANHD